MKKTAEEIYIEKGCNSKKDIIEAMEEYKDQHTAPLIEALEYITGQVKRLTTDMPEICYVNPLLLDCISEAEAALLNAKGL